MLNEKYTRMARIPSRPTIKGFAKGEVTLRVHGFDTKNLRYEHN